MENDGLDFGYYAMVRELETFGQTVAPFLEEGEARVKALTAALKHSFEFSYRKTATGDSLRMVEWTIPEELPIRTIPSEGEYEPGTRRGVHHVCGEVSGVWQIQPIHNKKKPTTLRLKGNASIRSRVVDLSDGIVLAQWQFEIGVHDSPGCHFHASAGQQLEKDDVLVTDSEPQFSLFPKSLSVPRMPGLLVTFVDAIDFLLGELFQKRWKIQAAGQGSELWGSYQRKRLVRLLKWQTQALERSSGSAWQHLKSEKPNDRKMLSV